jgi:hypothetical protein
MEPVDRQTYLACAPLHFARQLDARMPAKASDATATDDDTRIVLVKW